DLNREGDLLYTTGRTAISLWSRSTRKAVRLVTRGDPAPGGGRCEFLGSRPVLNDSGVVAFVDIVRVPPGRRRTETTGVSTADGPRLVSAAGGSLAAVSGPLQDAHAFAPRLTDSGRIAWVRDGRVESYDGESAHPVVAPDATPVGPSVSVSSPSINDGGVVAFAARQDGLYVRSRGTLARVAALGDAVGGVTIATIDTQVVRGGTVAFVARTAAGDPLRR